MDIVNLPIYYLRMRKSELQSLIRMFGANSDYRLHDMETGSFADRSRNRSRGYGTEDDGFSIEPWTFNFVEYSERFSALKIYFRQKWNTNFALSIYIHR